MTKKETVKAKLREVIASFADADGIIRDEHNQPISVAFGLSSGNDERTTIAAAGTQSGLSSIVLGMMREVAQSDDTQTRLSIQAMLIFLSSELLIKTAGNLKELNNEDNAK